MISFSEESVKIDCDVIAHKNVTFCSGLIDCANKRQRSYTFWSDAMEILGLMNVMYDSENGGSDYTRLNGHERYPLMTYPEGAAPITIEHVEEVERCLAVYKAKRPHSCDPVLRHGEWLAYWLRWAIENCERPVFVNS